MAAELVVQPGGLGLPHVDPRSLGMESALRFSRVNFTTRSSTSERAHVLVGAGAPLPQRAESITQVLDLLSRNRKNLDEPLSDVLLGECAALEAVAETYLFPTFEFLVSNDKGLSPSVPSRGGSGFLGAITSLWQPTHSAATSYASITEALSRAEKGMRTLDRFRRNKGARVDAVQQQKGKNNALGPSVATFILGTSYPTSADCFAYAAASCFLHMDVGCASDASIGKWQSTMRQELPLMVQYVEFVRLSFFEELSGQYNLKPIRAMNDTAADNSVYTDGRWKTTLFTATFAVFYFVVVNAQLVLVLLGGDQQTDQQQGVDDTGGASDEHKEQ